jgi:hypothetical protein
MVSNLVRVASLALPLSGCVSYGSHLTASPLTAGAREVSFNADALVVDRGFGAQILPNPELGYRWGLLPDLDVGGRVNAGGLEGNARWRVARGPVSGALVPGVGFGFVPVTNRDTGLLNAHLLLSALAGVEIARRSQLVIGARGAVTYAFPLTALRGAGGESTVYWLCGGVVGYRFPVGRQSFLFPELTVLYPYDSRRHDWLFPTVQGGVALQF